MLRIWESSKRTGEDTEGGGGERREERRAQRIDITTKYTKTRSSEKAEFRSCRSSGVAECGAIGLLKAVIYLRTGEDTEGNERAQRIDITTKTQRSSYGIGKNLYSPKLRVLCVSVVISILWVLSPLRVLAPVQAAGFWQTKGSAFCNS